MFPIDVSSFSLTKRFICQAISTIYYFVVFAFFWITEAYLFLTFFNVDTVATIVAENATALYIINAIGTFAFCIHFPIFTGFRGKLRKRIEEYNNKHYRS